MEAPIERNQIVFLNPQLTGLLAALLSHRAGAKVAIVNEFRQSERPTPNYPHAFPQEGTFRPEEVNLIAYENGFSQPLWQRFARLELHLHEFSISLNSDAGTGGLAIAITQPFKLDRTAIAEWLQGHLKLAQELTTSNSPGASITLRKVQTSVFNSIISLHLKAPDPFIYLLDTLSILVLGRGTAQLDISDLPLLFSTFLAGWHTPKAEERNWSSAILSRFIREGGRVHKIESIESIETIQGHQINEILIRIKDGRLISTRLLVFPECDRFRHPLTSGTSIIRWFKWTGALMEGYNANPILGLIRLDPSRPPINDNFLSFHLQTKTGRFTVSAPMEVRYLTEEKRLSAITSNIKLLLEEKLGSELIQLQPAPQAKLGEEISVPAGLSLSYSEKPLWGDDLLTRLKAAGELCSRALEMVK